MQFSYRGSAWPSIWATCTDERDVDGADRSLIARMLILTGLEKTFHQPRIKYGFFCSAPFLWHPTEHLPYKLQKTVLVLTFKSPLELLEIDVGDWYETSPVT